MPVVGRSWRPWLHVLNTILSWINNPVLAKPVVIIQIVCGIALTVLAGIEKSFTGFDSVPFYVVHTGISVFGGYCIFRNKTIPLFAYLIGYLIYALLVSIGFLLVSTDIDILSFQCETSTCDSATLNRLRLLDNARARNATLVCVEAVAIHPITNFVIYSFTKYKERSSPTGEGK